MRIILATTSPFKQKAFRNLGLAFNAEGSNVDESGLPRNNPAALVRNLARLKAEAVAKRHAGENVIVIGMDSVGYFSGKIIEKPKNRKEAISRLKQMSGRKHQAFTGICIINAKTGKRVQRVVKTDAWMRRLSTAEIEKYVSSDKNVMSICLGYDPESGFSASFVSRIAGSYNNLLTGMPIEVIKD